MGFYIKNIKIFLSVEKENGALCFTFTTGKNHSLLQINESSILDDDIVFNEQHCRGRPLGSKTVNTIGLPIQNLQAYKRKKWIQKAITLLKFLVDKNTIKNVLEGSYEIEYKDLEHITPVTHSDTFMDSEVNIEVLKYYISEDGLIYLEKIVKKKKEEKLYTCPTCKKEAANGTLACDSCLRWYHFKCANESEEIKDDESTFDS